MRREEGRGREGREAREGGEGGGRRNAGRKVSERNVGCMCRRVRSQKRGEGSGERLGEMREE